MRLRRTVAALASVLQRPAGRGVHLHAANAVYGLSVASWGAGILYNKDLLAKAGATTIPKTWDEFLALCHKLKDDRGFGHHADVVVGRDADGQEVGWIFYFTHRTSGIRLTDVHVAALRSVGDDLVCDRDAPVELDLRRSI